MNNEFHPRYVSSVAKIWNTVNVKLQQVLLRKWHHFILASEKRFPRCLIFTYFTINLKLLMSSVTSIIIHLMQTLWEFQQDITDAVIDQWHEHLRWHVCAGGGHFKHMHWNEFSFTWFIRKFLYCQCNMTRVNGCFVVNLKRWTCVHMHFRCCQLS